MGAGGSIAGGSLHSLKEAKARGIKTWASLEPIIDPAQSIEIVHRTHAFVDHYKVGKWNYDKQASLINWQEFVTDISTVFEKYGKDYYLKKSLKEYEDKA